MVLQYAVCDIELSNPEDFPYHGIFTYHVTFTYPGFLQESLKCLILGPLNNQNFPYPGIFPYPIKYSILEYGYLLKLNNNSKHKLSGRNDSL